MDVPSVILLQLGTIGVTVAVTKTRVSGLAARVRKVERKLDELPVTYVPRSEVDLALRGIESNTKHTNAMVQALIYGDQRGIKTLEAAAAVRDFAQITIEGIDGHGGLHRWEGRIPFLYLDSRKLDGVPAPLVTVGIGCALQLNEALTLPFQIGDRPATQIEIAADFNAIRHALPGLVATAYAGHTRCRLSPDAMADLVRQRFTVFICALRRFFPAFDTFPETVKAGCLDLIYGLGVAGLSPPHYPAFHAAILNFDWKCAADECGSDTNNEAYAARNEARRQLFLHATAVEPAKTSLQHQE